MSNASHQGLIPIEALTGPARPRFWRTLEEFEGSAQEPLPGEFSENGIELAGASRRKFLSLMAGSMALAGLTGCTRQPTETIMPYVEPPENVIPGKPKYYASAVPVNGIAEGVIIESHLGRPTKVEGNPDHPASLGSTNMLSQACLMDLYDANRAKEISHLGIPTDWDSFLLTLGETISATQERNGAGFRILTETIVSPVLGAQIQAALKKLPSAKLHQFGYVLPLIYLLWSWKYGKDAGLNPWRATGLEWKTPSPPPTNNFEVTPIVNVRPYDYEAMDEELNLV